MKAVAALFAFILMAELAWASVVVRRRGYYDDDCDYYPVRRRGRTDIIRRDTIDYLRPCSPIHYAYRPQSGRSLIDRLRIDDDGYGRPQALVGDRYDDFYDEYIDYP